ncbi:MAG: AMP-binding protein [Roseivivax sp.]|nr:AMP-binding protein [Roseivivax sp.]
MFDTVPDMALKRAQVSPDALAFYDTVGGQDWSFARVNAAADAIAAGLTEAGVGQGDRIAILCLNRVEFFLVLLACQKTGIILCPLNWRQPAPELVETLAPMSARMMLHDAANADLAAAVAAQTGAALAGLDDVVAGWIAAGGAPVRAAVPADRPWYLLFTSGTTGRPKAVIQTARMVWANTVNVGQAIRLTAEDRSVNFLPLFHTAGINLYTLPLFLNGGASTILPRFDAPTLMALLRAGAINQFFGLPAIYQALSLMTEVDTVDWNRIRCACGGAPLPEPLIRFYAQRGVRVLNGFGMTETGPTVFLMDEARSSEKIGSVGKPQMLTEARLEGVPEGPGAGEIQLRGSNITPGYFENPTATAQAFTADGWLKTGDVGRRDEDGYFFIVDRIKDMYISGGENVYPAEVERVLNEHPAVLEAAVVGMPDARWGEVGAAFVLLRPGQVLDDPEALRPWCRERLAAYKVPVTVRIVEDFPRTAAGKVRKPELRKVLSGD